MGHGDMEARVYRRQLPIQIGGVTGTDRLERDDLVEQMLRDHREHLGDRRLEHTVIGEGVQGVDGRVANDPARPVRCFSEGRSPEKAPPPGINRPDEKAPATRITADRPDLLSQLNELLIGQLPSVREQHCEQVLVHIGGSREPCLYLHKVTLIS